MKVGLTIDTAGTPNEIFTMLDILQDYNIKSTFFSGVKIQPEILRSIYRRGHEIGSHTYSHPSSMSNLSFDEKERDIRSGHFWLLDLLSKDSNDAEIKGFRMPFYNFYLDVLQILERLNYKWDSSKAYFPILDSYFKPEKYGGVIELPSLHPDDHTLLRRIGLSETQVLETWKKSFEMSNNIFIWGIHPYICVENKRRINMLKTFLDYILDKEADFLSMSEIACTCKKELDP